jgi:hypothetical protein
MASLEYTFPLEANTVRLAHDYIKLDGLWQMQARNGMPTLVCEDFWIMKAFMNHNDSRVADNEELLEPTPSQLDEIAKLCSEHYGRPVGRLKDSYQKVHNMDFYDPQLKERILRELAELKEEK